MDLASHATGLLWIGSLAAVPLAIVVAAVCRLPGCRPATRHALWVAVLASFVTPVLISIVWRPAWFESTRVLAAAERAIHVEEPAVAAPRVTQHATTDSKPAVNAAANRARERQPARASQSHPSSVVGTSKPGSTPSRHTGNAGLRSPKSSPVPIASESTVNPVVLSPAIQTLMRSVTDNQAQRARHAEPVVASAPVPLVEPIAPTPSAKVNSILGKDWAKEAYTWLAHALRLRDEFAQLPPLPLEIWCAGSVLVIGCWTLRAIALHRVLRRARPASSRTVALVEWSAEQMKLPFVPETLMVTDRVSPMIICSLRPKLILPVGLWAELDEASRRAVITHELAHLCRRDHWWCWLTALIGAAYWWHPVAWWARRKMRDEADVCCDAWVTSLLPGSRRAYAEALVATKSYLSLPGRCAPPGLGVMSGGAKRLARRVTMVMTQRVAPKASAWGVIAALGVAAAGMLVMPSLACPPEGQACSPEQAKKAVIIKPQKATATRPKVQFFGEAPALEAQRARGARNLAPLDALRGSDQTLRQLEERLNRLEQNLRALEGHSGHHPTPPHPAEAPTPPHPPRPAAAANPPMVASLYGHTPMAVTTPSNPLAYARAVQPYVTAFGTTVDGPDVVREYRLPDGKLEALINLMQRSDVPVLIEQRDGAIAVHASEGRQRIFAAFVQLIHPEAGMLGTTAPSQANPFVALSHVLGLAEKEKVKARAGAVDEMRKRMKELERGRRDAERQAERMRQRSDQAREKEQQLREQAEEKRNQITDVTEPAQRERLTAQLAQLTERADATVASAASLEASASTLENQVAAVEAEIASLEAMIEDMEAQLEAAAEAQEEMAQAAADEAARAADLAEAEADAAEEAEEAEESEMEVEAIEVPAVPEPTPAPAEVPSTR